MSRKEKLLGVLLIIGTLLTEAHSVLTAYNNELKDCEVDLFLFLDFSLSVTWYFKMLFENLFVVIIFFILAMLKEGYSTKFLKIICINVFYHAFDFVSFVLNYKQSYQLYWLVLTVITTWQILIIFGKEDKSIRMPVVKF